jgi:ParB family chromosome partitioning protein
MTAKKKGLGRGLDALLGSVRDIDTAPPGAAGGAAGDGGAGEGSSGAPLPERLHSLAVDRIQRGRYQPRRDFDPDSLRELADSIAAQGVIQPIVVRPVGEGRYEIVAGERRWRAAQQAGLAEIPVVVRAVDEQAAVAIALIENIQRDDLNPLEEATALQRLLGEFGLTHMQVAEAVGKSRTTVTNLLRLLELNDDVKRALEQGKLEMGHARALLGLKGPPQSAAAARVVSRGLSVRETERLVRRWQQEGEAAGAVAPKEKAPDPNVRRLQEDLADRLGARVQIQQGERGAGRLVIAYNSLDELDGILAHIR